MLPFVIYQDPLAYLLGLESIALLDVAAPSMVHQKRVTWSTYVALGNAPKESDTIIERLHPERDASRYCDRPISMSVDDVATALDHVHAVIEHVRNSCAPQHAVS